MEQTAKQNRTRHFPEKCSRTGQNKRRAENRGDKNPEVRQKRAKKEQGDVTNQRRRDMMKAKTGHERAELMQLKLCTSAHEHSSV